MDLHAVLIAELGALGQRLQQRTRGSRGEQKRATCADGERETDVDNLRWKPPSQSFGNF